MPDRSGTMGRSTVRRVAITGIGVIAPGDPGRDAFWSLITSGGSGVRRISRFDPSPFSFTDRRRMRYRGCGYRSPGERKW